MAKMRVLLAYSGGLDTSIIVPWLKENYDCDVVCVAGDVGQGEELEPLHEKAKKCGAEKLYIEDLRKEFVEDFIWPTLKAGAVYEGKYLLGTSFARPLIAKRLVEIAHKENCTAICHGCTGKGNTQLTVSPAFASTRPVQIATGTGHADGQVLLLCLHTPRADCNRRQPRHIHRHLDFASTRPVQIATVDVADVPN